LEFALGEVKMKPVIFVVGTRPDIIKMAPIIKRMPEAIVLHTGQHYSPELSQHFVDEYGIKIDHVLVDGHDTDVAQLFGPLACATERYLYKQYDADFVAVYGDTLSASAVAIGVKRAGFKLAHVEAGLRSGDLGMPEEVARIHIDSLSDLLLAPTEWAAKNVAYRRNVHMVGNTIQDVLQPRLDNPRTRRPVALLTLHRRENKKVFSQLIYRVVKIAMALNLQEVVYPVHPSNDLIRYRATHLDPCIVYKFPMSHQQTLDLVQEARIVLTDSGGLQEECALLGTPCITLRTTTERPETVKSDWNILMHPDILGWDNWEKRLDLHMKCSPRTPFRYSVASPADEIVKVFRAARATYWY
jgi:UDP-N-acetylglucosamine 2-epimerase (non-hydrolysing)